MKTLETSLHENLQQDFQIKEKKMDLQCGEEERFAIQLRERNGDREPEKECEAGGRRRRRRMGVCESEEEGTRGKHRE